MQDALLFGLSNPVLDEELEAQIRLDKPSYDDKKVLDEMNKQKKKLTFFNEKNSKKNSTKKPKNVKAK